MRYLGRRNRIRLAGRLFTSAGNRAAQHKGAGESIAAGLLGLLSLVVSASAIAGLVIIVVAGLASVLYSLAYYKRLERRNQL
jgi:hypothetical protein